MSDIFISYKREDQAIARNLANALESEGWTVWWDPKLRAGEHFDDVIEKALNEAKCVIVMWSERSVQSRYVRDEATYALDQDKLVPVTIENVNLPFRFRGVHTLSLPGWNGSKDFSEFRRLVEDIVAIVGPPVTEARRKTDVEKEGNGATQEARAQRRAQKERLREQERQCSEEDAKRKAGEDNRKRIKKERNRAEQEKERRRPRKQPSARQPTVEQPRGELKSGAIFRDKLKDGSQGPEMVVIPAGTFQMGDHYYKKGYRFEVPVHQVRIPKPFAMGRFEVTFKEYDRFAAATRRELPEDKGWGRGRLPVINVSWNDAIAYAEWLSQQTAKRYRLPTEAEWEYGARAGTDTAYWWGKEMKPSMANYNERGTLRGRTHHSLPVGSFQPNLFGLYDTAGNVSEWVQDHWHLNYDGAPTDGSEWYNKIGVSARRLYEGRVFRGGSFGDKQRDLRSSQRNWSGPDARSNSIGFRLAGDID